MLHVAFPQCSGYHVRLTRVRSSVRYRAETQLFFLLRFLLQIRHIFSITSQDTMAPFLSLVTKTDSKKILIFFKAENISSQSIILLPHGESNPGLPRDRRRYSPLYHRGTYVKCSLDFNDTKSYQLQIMYKDLNTRKINLNFTQCYKKDFCLNATTTFYLYLPPNSLIL